MEKEKGLQGPQPQCCPWHHHPHSQWGSSWDCSLPSNIIPAVVGVQSRRGTWGLPGENSIVPAERGSSYLTWTNQLLSLALLSTSTKQQLRYCGRPFLL